MSIRIHSTFTGGAVIAGIVAGFVFGNLLSPAAGADAARIPNFASEPTISWSLEGRLDDLLPPTSGPSPVTFDPAHPFNPGINYRVADLGNPILQPAPLNVARYRIEPASASTVRRSPSTR